MVRRCREILYVFSTFPSILELYREECCWLLPCNSCGMNNRDSHTSAWAQPHRAGRFCRLHSHSQGDRHGSGDGVDRRKDIGRRIRQGTDGLYLVLKIGDLLLAGDGAYLFSSGYLSFLFWAEVLINIIIPMVLLSIPSVRQKPMQMFAAALLVVVGLLMNRFNISLVAFSAGAYMPSWLELFVTIGMIAIGALVFTLAARYLAVFSHPTEEKTKSSISDGSLKEAASANPSNK